jgi:hypothetical protein
MCVPSVFQPVEKNHVASARKKTMILLFLIRLYDGMISCDGIISYDGIKCVCMTFENIEITPGRKDVKETTPTALPSRKLLHQPPIDCPALISFAGTQSPPYPVRLLQLLFFAQL